MKKSQVLAALALIMALGLAAPTIFSASAEENTEKAAAEIEQTAPDGDIVPTELDESAETADENIAVSGASTLSELQTALDADPETVLISATITIEDDVTLDLKGKTLKLANDLNRMFAVQKGNVTIKNGTLQSNDSETQTGNAIIWITGSDADADFANHTTLTVESDVKILTKNSYGLAVHYLTDKQLARGVTINLAGEIEAPYGISVNGNIQDTQNAPVINLSGKITSTDNDLAIFAAGYAEWNLDGATLTGYTPLGLKAGKFTLKNSTLNATGEYKELSATGSGMTPNGSVIQIENSQPYAGEIDITVKSGVYTSAKGPVFSEYGSTAARTAGSNVKSLSISGGTFTSATDMPIFANVVTAETVITGGNFSNDEGLEDYLQSDQKLVKDENGNFIIQTTNTPTQPSNLDNKPSDDINNQPATKPDADKKPSSSSPNTGILAGIESAANAVGAIGTTILTGVFVVSGAALAWIIGSRRNKAKSASKSSKSGKNSRSYRLDRVEVEISAAPRTSAKSASKPSKASKKPSKAISASTKASKSSAKSAKSASKTTKKLPAKSAKTSKKPSSSAKSASSRKTASSPSKSAKASKKR